MKEKLRFLGMDVHAETIAAAIAEPDGEVRGDKGTRYLLQQFWGIGILSPYPPPSPFSRCHTPAARRLRIHKTKRKRAEVSPMNAVPACLSLGVQSSILIAGSEEDALRKLPP
jgi:hypothetical protein